MDTLAQQHPTRDDLNWFLQQSRPRRRRSMRQFAEQEIVIPSGPFVGRRFRCARQPYTALWFDAVDSGRWSRCVGTGPTQSGKTLACFIIPLLYHLFEIGETVICGVPDMDMASDKWKEDLLPVIAQSRFRELLPSQGSGSRGGLVEYLQFGNGATLKFMSGGGSDKSRAGFTSRVVVITETDGMDKPGVSSRESDKITQLEARTRAYGSRKRIYMECTVSTETGRTWQEYTKGTKSRIALPCPICHAWVRPEREHLTGWQGAESQGAAQTAGAFSCPSCSQIWSNEQRILANDHAMLLHDGQSVDGQSGDSSDVVVGDAPHTDTLGFRWSAVNNLFLTAGEVAADEWRASRSSDEESADRELRQFVWCIPVVPTKLTQTSLEIHELAARMIDVPKGIVPANMPLITAGIDIGKYLLHWIVVGWTPQADGHIVEYGRVEVASDSLGVEQGVMVALRELKDVMLEGWPSGGLDGRKLQPGQVFVDAGYMTDVIYSFCRESGERFRPAFGRGTGQQYKQQWAERTTQTGSVVKLIGEGCHASWVPIQQLHILEADADHWKTWVHQRLSTPMGKPGAMTLYRAPPQEHLSLAKHLTAEAKTEEFVAGKGVVTKWERIRRQNHWLDALYNSCVAAHGCGVKLVQEIVPGNPAPPSPPRDPDRDRWIEPSEVKNWLHGHKGRW
ncbi:MAG: terminase gpA endonuclease subunit [Planctomycetaceae bacterium]|nr:terminase gpA endonuclease subunit [Planctomycetaceae bacterium]